jgi:hypothetical protein
LKGGGDKIIPMYKQPKNSPFVSNIQKEVQAPEQPVYQSNYKGNPNNFKGNPGNSSNFKGRPGSFKNKPTDQRPQSSFVGKAGKPLVDLQVYEPSKPARPPKPVDPTAYMPIMSQNPYLPPQMGYAGHPYPMYHNPQQQPIIKNYNIDVRGPMTDHAKLNMLYEDILPSKNFSNTSVTVGERISNYLFARSILIKHDDGEDVSLDEGSNNGLLSHIKLMDLNPYNTYKYSDNPYKGLPTNLLLFNFCWPVQLDRQSGKLTCSKNSLGMNLRIYKLSYKEYDVKQHDISYYNNDVWRELAYYAYIREQIVKQRVCPNFSIMFCYYICEKCNIDWGKLSQLKNKNKSIENQPKYIREIINKDGTVVRETDINNDLRYSVKHPLKHDIPQPIDLNVLPKHKGGGANITGNIDVITNNEGSVDKRININITADTKKEQEAILRLNKNADSGRALVVLTEAATYSLYGWASNLYEAEGNIRRQISYGIHSEIEWKSVLFQMMAGLYALQIHGIAFRDFSIENNVYVKDISSHSGGSTSYWKYKINGIDYYIPNMGYLVVIDSKYQDIEDSGFSISNTHKNTKAPYKIYSNIYTRDGGTNWKHSSINDACMKAFKNSISPNAFSKEFTNNSGVRPPDSIIKIMNDIISDEGSNRDIGYYIENYMSFFMNNRIGTYLTLLEQESIRKEDKRKFKQGQLVVFESEYNTYKFVLYNSNGTDEDTANVFTKEDTTHTDVIPTNIPITSLFNYAYHDPILQTFKPNEANLSEEDLLETYTMNRNV